MRAVVRNLCNLRLLKSLYLKHTQNYEEVHSETTPPNAALKQPPDSRIIVIIGTMNSD